MSVPVIKQAANKFYYVHWSDGRRSKRESLGTKEEAEATQRFAQWLLIGGSKKVDAEVDYTVADCWTVYWEKHGRHTAGAATLGYGWARLEPHFGKLAIPEVDQDRVDEYTRLRTSGKLGRKVKEPTVRRELTTLMAAINFCAGSPHKMFNKAIIEDVTLPDAGDPRDRWLRMDEMQRLLNAAAKLRRGGRLSRGERFLWLALETAARKEAILDLEWSRVDFDVGVIHYDVPGRVKTKKRRASVTISSALRPVLLRAYKERQNELVLDNKGAVWATVQHIAIEAGFSDQEVERGHKPKKTGISPHVLRHTAATHMARRGVPLWVIAKILGNSLAMVEKVYAKWVPENPAGTVDMISGGLLEPAE
jgi:integrase